MPKLQCLVQEAISHPDVTVEQFLCNGVPESCLSSLSEQALTEILNSLKHQAAPPVWTGSELLHDLQTQANIVPTGCSSVDNLLNGGLREGHLTELYGESASGKTQLCIMAAVASAMRGDQILYFDTSASFSGRRVATVYDELHLRMQDNTTLTQVLQNIQVNRVHSVHEVLAVLDATALAMQGLMNRYTVCQPKMIILDSLSALIAPVLGAGGSQQSHGHALMSALGCMLKYIAMRYTVAVLCTNHMVGSGTNPRPALGESWKNQPCTRLQLVRPDVGNDRHAVLVASGTAGCKQQATFQLS